MNERLNKSKDERFWDQKAYKQCLWGYFLANGSKPLTEKDYDKVWKQFNDIEADAVKRYEVEEEQGRSNGELAADLVDEINLIQKTKKISELKEMLIKFKKKKQRDQYVYLKKLIKRRASQIKEAKAR